MLLSFLRNVYNHSRKTIIFQVIIYRSDQVSSAQNLTVFPFYSQSRYPYPKLFPQEGVAYVCPQVILFAVSAHFVLFNPQKRKRSSRIILQILGVKGVGLMGEVLLMILT